MLNAHIDTVQASDGYSFDPCRPDYEKVREIFGFGQEDMVCGLGSNDDGGSVVSLCAAFRYFYGRELLIFITTRVRGEIKFSESEGLVAQMKKDVEACRADTKDYMKKNAETMEKFAAVL